MKNYSPGAPWIHPDDVESFALFLQHNKKKVEGDKNVVDVSEEVDGEEEEEDKSDNKEEDEVDEEDEEEDDSSKLGIFEAMHGILSDFCAAVTVIFSHGCDLVSGCQM